METTELEKIRTLTLDEKTATQYYGSFIAEPFDRGYGQTVGNALRRVLLSSLEGAAITSVKIKGASHEFASLKGVKEDVANIILNLKKIRLKMFTDGHETLILSVDKEGVIKAKDIEPNSNVEILTPEQPIATLDFGASIEMELQISKGKGYVLADENKSGKQAVGSIVIDALFSPVVKVNYEVENTRVEQITDYDKLIIQIWTDGSIAPADALAYSSKILRNTFCIFTGEKAEAAQLTTQESATSIEDKAKLALSINDLDLSVRAKNCLIRAEIQTVGELISKEEGELLAYKNFGKNSLDEIKTKLEELGFSLKAREQEND